MGSEVGELVDTTKFLDVMNAEPDSQHEDREVANAKAQNLNNKNVADNVANEQDNPASNGRLPPSNKVLVYKQGTQQPQQPPQPPQQAPPQQAPPSTPPLSQPVSGDHIRSPEGILVQFKEKCILTTGDASDFDGFLALPLYYKAAMDNDYDVVFVMNYPAFLNPANKDKEKYNIANDEYNIGSFGKGYTYNYTELKAVLLQTIENGLNLINPPKGHTKTFGIDLIKNEDDERKLQENVKNILKALNEKKENYTPWINSSADDEAKKEINEKIKSLDGAINSIPRYLYIKDIDLSGYKENLDKTTKYIISAIWKWCHETYGMSDMADMADKGKEGSRKKPNIYYIESNTYNSVNPFHANVIKMEHFVYKDVIGDKIDNVDNIILGESVDSLNNYKEIIMDMNGSMAWFSDFSPHPPNDKKEEFVKKVQKCFVMGGVMDNSVVDTMSAIPGVLNRLSSATMNQLYHKENTNEFFKMMDGSKLTFVTNNEINATFSWKESNYNDFKVALKGARLIPSDDKHVVTQLFDVFYKTRQPDRKPFDVISGLYLIDYITKIDNFKYISNNTKLYYNLDYGSTILSDKDKPTLGFIMNNFKKGIVNVPKEIDIYKDKEFEFEDPKNVKIVSTLGCKDGKTDIASKEEAKKVYLDAIILFMTTNVVTKKGGGRGIIVYRPIPKYPKYKPQKVPIGKETINGKLFQIFKKEGSRKYYINTKELGSKYKKYIKSLKNKK